MVRWSDGIFRNPADDPMGPRCEARHGLIRCSFLADHQGSHHWYRSLRIGPWTVRINRA